MENNENLNFDSLADFTYDINDMESISDEKKAILSQLNVGVQSIDEYSEQTEVLNTIEENTPIVKIDLSDVDTENIVLSKTEIIRALRYAMIMIKKVTNDIEASSLNITYSDEGKVLYRLKDNMTYVEIVGTCSVCKEKPILKTLSFNTTYLTKLLSAATEDVLIYKDKVVDSIGNEKEVYKVRLINGDMILDLFEGNESKLVAPGTKSKLLFTLDGSTASTLCDVMVPLIQDSQEVASKRAIMYNDRAVFRSVTYVLEIKRNFPNMCLTKKELDLLKVVSSKVGSNNIEFYSVDSNGENRIMIVAPNVTISSSVSIPSVDETIVARCLELENAKYMEITKDDFKRVLFLSGLGTNNTARVTMNYNVENLGIDAAIEGRDGKSSFLISGNNYNNLEPRSQDVTIYAVQLSVLLRSFDSAKKLEIAFLNSGVAFRNEELGIYAVMNYSR